MKTMKKLAGLLLALVMIFAVATTAFAENNDNKTTITINPPAGTLGTNEYKIYKVFDAAGSGETVAYRLVEGKTTAPAGFNVKDGYVTYAGGDSVTELNAADIAAIAAYVTSDDLVATVTSTNENPATFETTEMGYYYITTSTGSVVAINTLGQNREIQDKNTIPGIEKVITNASDVTNGNAESAMAELGSTVTYQVTITVGKGAKNYVFHDTMDSRLTFNSVTSVTNADGDAINYTLNTTPNDNHTFDIIFADADLPETGATITITYTATITGQATDTPATNSAYVSYGDKNYTTNDFTSVYNAQFTVTKQDGDKKPLEGAGFVVKNASNKYYKLVTDETSGKQTVTWVDNIDDATEHVSAADGMVAPFIGLANGTYTLEEKTVPPGYNKADDKTFTIAGNNYTPDNLKQAAEVTNNAGTQLPSTGGMGTKLFYALGGILVVGAIVLLVTKKRMTSE